MISVKSLRLSTGTDIQGYWAEAQKGMERTRKINCNLNHIMIFF
jgi:hypothetical protein